MDVKQEPFDPNTEIIKMEPDLDSDQMNGNDWCSTKDKMYKNDEDSVHSDTDNICEYQTTREFVNVDIKQECELPKIESSDFLKHIDYESVCDNVNNFLNTIKKEPENANEIKAEYIKPAISEISEYVQFILKDESELLTPHCDLPTLKNEVANYSNYFAQPCSSKQTIIKSKSLKHSLRNVPKQKKMGYPWSVLQKNFRSSPKNQCNAQFKKCCEICYHCNQFFLTKSQFLYHFIVVHYVKKVTKVCKKKIGQYKYCRCKNCLHNIFRHPTTPNIIFHSNETFLQCEICSKTFPIEINLNNHLKIHTAKNFFTCKICLKQFALKVNLKRHLKFHTGEKQFRCEICSKQFTLKRYLNRHLKIHTGEKPFNCEICSKRFTNKQSLKDHLMIHTGEKLFSCEICSKRFIKKGDLKRHLNIHTGVKLSKCEICSNEPACCHFEANLESQTGDKPFECEICLKRFTQKGSLKTHLKIHTGEKSFMCEICSKEFSRKDTLEMHYLVHNKEEPFQCKLCLKQFTRKDSLETHLIFHSKDEPFKCKTCSKRFSRKDKFETHLQIHTGEKPFQCKICYKRFLGRADLKNHLKIHIREKTKIGKKLI